VRHAQSEQTGCSTEVASADPEKLLWSVVEIEIEKYYEGIAYPSNIELVCWLPARKQLSINVVFQLLQAAIQHGNKCMLRGLSNLKIARQLDVELMQQVQAALLPPGAWCHARGAPAQTVCSDAAQTVCSDAGAVEGFTSIGRACCSE
jgi:hypothetical protein